MDTTKIKIDVILAVLKTWIKNFEMTEQAKEKAEKLVADIEKAKFDTQEQLLAIHTFLEEEEGTEDFSAFWNDIQEYIEAPGRTSYELFTQFARVSRIKEGSDYKLDGILSFPTKAIMIQAKEVYMEPLRELILAMGYAAKVELLK